MESTLTPTQTNNDTIGVLAELLCTSNEQIKITSIRKSETKESYRVQHGSDLYFAKIYHDDTHHCKDRMLQEWKYSDFMRNIGVTCIPAPIVKNDEKGVALYEYIDGKAPKPEEFTASFLDEALSFHLKVNEHAQHEKATELPDAYEAAFSFEDHMNYVQQRMNRFEYIKGDSSEDQQCKDFITCSIEPMWDQMKDHIHMAALKLGTPQNIKLADTERWLSPADFGFHNMLIDKAGCVHFVDFEYAGWDDPSRMICDFFHHPSFPVPARCKKRFTEKAFHSLNDPDLHIERCMNLEPVMLLKWTCILLNPFLPTEIIGHQVHRSDDISLQDLKNNRLSQAKSFLCQCRESLKLIQ